MHAWTILINLYIYFFFISHILSCMYIDFIIKVFLWIWPQSEKSSCIFRASPAQAPRKQKDASRWKWGTGPHVPPAYYSHQSSRQRRLAKYCQRDLSTQRRRKGRQNIAVKERQRKARSDVMSCSSSATSSSDSSDWKKVRASALVQGNWSLSVFASRFDDCQTRYVF